MLDMMNDPKIPADLRLRAAAAAIPYMHGRKADAGIKDERQSKAEQAAEGLRPAAAPRLVSNG
jgi:phage terminase small subunit